jgi:hypothetical protein
LPLATLSATAVVADDHLVVPTSVAGPVVVTFDGLYVWSFVANRDGSRTLGGWRVPWPAMMQARLDGTTRVRLTDPLGERVHFDAVVAFRGTTTQLTCANTSASTRTSATAACWAPCVKDG